ncbi:TPR repeat-containing protein YrrB [mine drainage metagenome]|uniref:TPR repeat-containing protein YrrB n=1 Tax=mine drainage metagenome TaxID=410659 RepID=A0A1J5RDG4_9ZZZZ
MIRLPPNASIEALFAQAVALHAAGETSGAEQLYRALMARAPGQAAIPLNLGSLLQAQGRHKEAVACFRKAVATKPGMAEAHNNLGVALQSLGREAEAAKSFRRAIALTPGMAEAHRNLGIAHSRQGQPDEALASFQKAAALRPGHVDTLIELGRTLHELRRYPEAVEIYGRALALKPDAAHILNDLGAAQDLAGDKAGAMASLRRAIALDDSSANPRNNLGKLLEAEGDLDGAEEMFRAALERAPGLAEVHGNLGNICMERRRIDEGIAHYRAAIALKADFFEAHVSLGMALLTQGQYAEGWAEWEWRWYRRAWLTPSLRFQRPLAEGERLDGKRVLLFAEQGFGDVLHFCRYALLLRERGAQVILKVYPALVRLLRSLPGGCSIIAEDDPEPPHDLRLPMMSAPFVFQSGEAPIPAPCPYLAPQAEEAAGWARRLAALPGRKVGLVWAGDPRPHDPGAHLVDRRRSLRLRQFAALAALPGLSLVSLQKGAPAAQAAASPFPLFDAMAEVGDFADTAALVANLDLVITADTSMAHVAGALGKPVWVLSRFDGCWRWGEQGPATPWYPSMRLYRQPRPGDWDEPLRRILADLQALPPA